MAEVVEVLDRVQSHPSTDTTDSNANGNQLDISSSREMSPSSFELQDQLILPENSVKVELDCVLNVESGAGPESDARSHEGTCQLPIKAQDKALFPQDSIKMERLGSSQQQKRELYSKLDTILINALKEEFEVWPGHTVDRQDMVEYLRGVVMQYVDEYPELEKVLSLRDTVLTGRVKRAFPGVEYKRKQMRQDHYRKAWLYVNIRRRSAPYTDPVKGGTMIKSSVSATSTWTPPVLPESMLPRQSPLNSNIQPSADHVAPCPTLVVSSSSSSPEIITTPHAAEPSSSDDDETNDAAASLDSADSSFAKEHSALVLDNLTIVRWVRSNYVEDGASHVPVQDVVKAFKEAFNYDISYKECHQMIYSTFTSPRNRSSPMKTVRVSSLGQQYIYRGIAHIDRKNLGIVVVDKATHSQATSEEMHSEREEAWKQMVVDLKQERDQGVMERNQALAALVKLEKTHAQALTTIERLEEVDSPGRSGASPEEETPAHARQEANNDGVDREENVSFNHVLRKFGQPCEQCAYIEKSHERIKDERDQIWKEIVTHAQHERDGALRRLEIVKQERDNYLERLHSLEKENQQLRDEVNARFSETKSCRPVADFNPSWPFKTNPCENGDPKEALSSVLTHLRSKRKQAAPSRFSKASKLNDTEENSVTAADERESGPDTPPRMHSGSTTPQTHSTPDVNDAVHWSQTGRKLMATQGSEMVAFRRHPLDE